MNEDRNYHDSYGGCRVTFAKLGKPWPRSRLEFLNEGCIGTLEVGVVVVQQNSQRLFFCRGAQFFNCLAEGHHWIQVMFRSCQILRSIEGELRFLTPHPSFITFAISVTLGFIITLILYFHPCYPWFLSAPCSPRPRWWAATPSWLFQS